MVLIFPELARSLLVLARAKSVHPILLDVLVHVILPRIRRSRLRRRSPRKCRRASRDVRHRGDWSSLFSQPFAALTGLSRVAFALTVAQLFAFEVVAAFEVAGAPQDAVDAAIAVRGPGAVLVIVRHQGRSMVSVSYSDRSPRLPHRQSYECRDALPVK